MKDNLFVIAIGGTGMRCLESFVHLCAIGMFDDKVINILTLDTDQTNGNKERVETLINLYNRVRSDNPDEKKETDDKTSRKTFFSAKLNLYCFYTSYGKNSENTYQSITGVQDSDKDENFILSNLFFEKNSVQKFDLSRGYRAQTHLGSMLMYHGIVDAERKYITNKENAATQEKALGEYIARLYRSEKARVFVFGSIFGGTGASSIPVIPAALRDAVALNNAKLDTEKIKFGSTLLTEYFTFPSPDEKQMKEEKNIIANAAYFPINSQAALQFYQQDPTVKKFYRRLYHVGWPLESKSISPKATNVEGNGQKVITGGRDQKNNCHVVEMMCAAAAYDFFKDDTDLSNSEAYYLYRSVSSSNNGVLDFWANDFVGPDADSLYSKIKGFLYLSHMIPFTGTKGLINHMTKQGVDDYKDIPDEQCKEFDDYLKKYAYNFDNGSIEYGWLYQVRNTVNGSFLFENDMFEENRNELEKRWLKGGMFSHSMFDSFVELLVKTLHDESEQKTSNKKEELIARLYKSIMIFMEQIDKKKK